MYAKYYPEILKAIDHFGEKDVDIGIILKYSLRGLSLKAAVRPWHLLRGPSP